MKRAIFLVVLLILLSMFVACADEKPKSTEETIPTLADSLNASEDDVITTSFSPTKETTPENTTSAVDFSSVVQTTQEELPPATQHITWVLGIIGAPREEGKKQINRLLLEKGYDCEIHFVVPEREDLDLKILNKDTIRPWYASYESNNPPVDIMYTGAWGYDRFHGLDFVRDNCIPLSDYLETEEGRPLKEFFCPYQWSLTSFGGVAYALPHMLTTDQASETPVLHVADRYAQYFDDFDGSYASLKQIFEQHHQEDELIEVEVTYALKSFVEDVSYLGTIPYDSHTRSFVGSNEILSYVDIITEIYTDFQNGILYYNGANAAGPMPKEHLFAYIDDRDDGMEGFTPIKLKGSLCDFNFSMTYGVSQKSENKELALKILNVCYTDPEISRYLLPEMGGEESINRMREQLSAYRIVEIEEFAPNLSENQKDAITTYPFRNVFEDMFVYMYDAEKHSYIWALNEEYDVASICQKLEAPEYRELIDELNRQLDAFFQTKGAS